MASGIDHRTPYPPAVRDFCISLKNTSPAAYRFVRNEFNNNLPHPLTITAWHVNSDLDCEPGIMSHSMNILKRKVSEKAANNEKLIGALLFDEVTIRKHFQWVDGKIIGFEYIPGMDRSKADVASETLVFMLTAINDNFRLPIAYYFVTKKINATTKMNLLYSVLDALIDCGVEVKTITFDGLKTNPAMCRLMGANLDVFAETFNSSIKYRDKEICILYDFSQVEKLARNNLSLKKCFYDADNNPIKWEYFERLVDFQDKRNFALTHKLTRAHIQWSSNPMKVSLAVEIFSAKTARSMEFLMNQGHPEFTGAGPTIRLIRVFDNLFNVSNSTDNTKENPLKNHMNPCNIEQIYQLFQDAREYIKGLMVIENGKKVKLCKSSVKTGFQGFLINIESLSKLYNDIVVENELMPSIGTHTMSQDHLEVTIFFFIFNLKIFNLEFFINLNQIT